MKVEKILVPLEPLPVLDGDRLVGILTETDIVRAFAVRTSRLWRRPTPRITAGW